MQALKGLVVGLGILIIVGFLVLVYGFYVKLSDPDFKPFKDSEDPPAEEELVGPVQDLKLDLEPGCNVVDMRPEGTRLLLRTGPTGLCERIIIIDMRTMKTLGTIFVRP